MSDTISKSAVLAEIKNLEEFVAAGILAWQILGFDSSSPQIDSLEFVAENIDSLNTRISNL